MTAERPEKVPAYSEEAERGVLGSILLDGPRVLGLLAQAGLGEEAFYVPAHQRLFVALRTMAQQDRPIDLLTVNQFLKDAGESERTGGPQFLETLVDQTPTATHADYYTGILREKWMRRRMRVWGQQILAECDECGDGPETILSRMLEHGNGIGNELMPEQRTNAEVLDGLVQDWENAARLRKNDDEHVPGLKSPFKRMNQVLGGLQPGLHFFGGKSSAGKTALIINICDWFAHNGHPGLVIQLDDTHEDMVGRIVAMRARLSLPYLSQGFARREQLDYIRTDIRAELAQLPIHVVEECEDVVQAAALAKFHHVKHKIKWVVIDYVQVLDADGNPRDDERQRLGKIAKHLKRLWKSLRLPVLVVSQTSKFKDKEDDGRSADMSDLFGASELFHAATSVTIVKKVGDVPQQAVADTGNDYTHRYAVAAHVVKNKHGPKDQMIYFWLTPRYFFFEETLFKGSGTNAMQMTWEEEIEHTRGQPPPYIKSDGWRGGGRKKAEKKPQINADGR